MQHVKNLIAELANHAMTKQGARDDPSRRGSDSETVTEYKPRGRSHSTRKAARLWQPLSYWSSRHSRDVLVPQTIFPAASLTCMPRLSSAIFAVVVKSTAISSILEESSGTQAADTDAMRALASIL